MKKNTSLLILISLLVPIGLVYTQCGQNARLYRPTEAEEKIFKSAVFSFNDFNAKTTVVDDTKDMYDLLWDGSDGNFDLGDSYIPVNYDKGDKENFQWVARCNLLEDVNGTVTREKYIRSVIGNGDISQYSGITSSYDLEKVYVKKQAMQRFEDIKNGVKGADGKVLPLLIPVEYSFSTGDKHDRNSYMAYWRSILRKDHNNISYIQPDNLAWKHKDDRFLTYKVDSERAKKDYVSGKMQYFSLVEVKENMLARSKNFIDFSKESGARFSYWQAWNYHNTGSGLKGISNVARYMEEEGDAPIAKIYLADIRDEILPYPEKYEIIYPDLTSEYARNSDIMGRLKDIFNLRTLFRNRIKITAGLSVKRDIKKKGYRATYEPYEGMAQVLQRMNCDVGESRVISARYTPLVLDLGAPHIRTTSEYWGSFFNLSNAAVIEDDVKQDNLVAPNTFTHRTAWVGGKIMKVDNPTKEIPGVTLKKDFMWQRVADDGFLVLPPDSGEVTAAHLFGSHFKNPDGSRSRYENGFKALQDYAGTQKACETPVNKEFSGESPSDEQLKIRYKQIKDRYVGPWNPVYDKLKLWIDRDLNGRIDSEELHSLESQGVHAINTCLGSINNIAEYDQYGNHTSLRSAFLYIDPKETKDLSQEQIMHRLTFGTDKRGIEVNFRAMIDIYFKARPYHFLERSLHFRSENNSKGYQIEIEGDRHTEETLSSGNPVLIN